MSERCPTCGRRGYTDERKEIVSAVAKVSGVSMRAIMSKRRIQTVVDARIASAMLIHARLNVPKTAVAVYLNHDGTTWYYWNRIADTTGPRGQRVRHLMIRASRLLPDQEAA